MSPTLVKISNHFYLHKGGLRFNCPLCEPQQLQPQAPKGLSQGNIDRGQIAIVVWVLYPFVLFSITDTFVFDASLATDSQEDAWSKKTPLLY